MSPTRLASKTSGRGQRRIVMWIAAGLLALLMVGVSAMALSDQHTAEVGDTHPDLTPPTTRNHRSPAAEEPTAAVLPTAAPDGITWQLLGQAAVPYLSSTGGPNMLAGLPHTPTGALVAAAQICTRAGYSSGRPVWEPTLREQFAASPDRDTLLSLLIQADVDHQPPAAPGELSQIAGFRFYSYTPAIAVLGLIRRSPSGMYAITTLTLLWQAEQWRMVAPPQGRWTSATTPITDLTGVIAWGAS